MRIPRIQEHYRSYVGAGLTYLLEGVTAFLVAASLLVDRVVRLREGAMLECNFSNYGRRLERPVEIFGFHVYSTGCCFHKYSTVLYLIPKNLVGLLYD